MEDIAENDGWYNGLKLLRYWDDAILYFVIGGRGIGKTDFWLRVACELWLRHECRTAWLRNKKVELSDDGNFQSFLTDAKTLGWCPEEWEPRPDGIYESSDGEARQIIRFASISTFSNMRGGSYGGESAVMLIVLDEMIPEDRRYPRMCAKGLLSIANTVTRGREGSRIVALSNYVSAGNPYFALFEVYPNKKYDVTVYKDKAIAIEVCRGYRRAIKEDSAFARLMKAGRMPQYEDERSDPLIGLVAKVPNGAQPAPWLYLIDGRFYREWVHDDIRYYDEWRAKVPENIMIYTPNVIECTDGVQLLPKFMAKHLNETMSLNLMRFKSPNVMFKILNVIYNGVRGWDT